MSLREIVIIGAGQAGFQVAASLRQDGFDGRILMLGDESHLPYQRPPLSKTFLKDGNIDRLLFRTEEFFATNRIDIEFGTRAAAIDPVDGMVRTEHGRRYRFDHLVLATGTRNRRLPIAGLDAPNVFGMRTLVDAMSIRQQLAGMNTVVVIGGGFIGLEFAAAARQFGKRIVVVEAQQRLMARSVSAPISDYFLAAHRDSGNEVMLQKTIASVETSGFGRASAIVFGDGNRITCDAILVAAGVIPNSELARDAGLLVDNGIVVDETMLTSAANISAVGDCVSFPANRVMTRLESVQNAVDQARCVSRRLVGFPEPYDKLPWFWSDQGNDKLQIAGLVSRADTIVVAPVKQAGRISVFGFEANRLCSVETVNAPSDHMAARKLLSAKRQLGLTDIEAAEFSLKNLQV